MNLNSTPLSRALCYIAVSLTLFICAWFLLITPEMKGFEIMAGIFIGCGLAMLIPPADDNWDAIKAFVKPSNYLNR